MELIEPFDVPEEDMRIILHTEDLKKLNKVIEAINKLIIERKSNPSPELQLLIDWNKRNEKRENMLNTTITNKLCGLL